MNRGVERAVERAVEGENGRRVEALFWRES